MKNDISEINDKFYKLFEDKFRGPRELIKERLKVYLPFIKPLLQIYPTPSAIDLGCGRGEWLELLQESGFIAHGVDLMRGMLDPCLERNLSVSLKDAVTALQELPDNSQGVVSGFHIAEHIEFSKLQVLIQESLRVLRPGGLLILETPNSENIFVGTTAFYCDPTHQRVIPIQLLYFLFEFFGFVRMQTLRLNEDSSLIKNANITLEDVLNGVSPDYSIIGQKIGGAHILNAWNDTFDQIYGVQLNTLCNRYDAQLNKKIENLNEKIENLNEKIKSIDRTFEFDKKKSTRLSKLKKMLKKFLNIFSKK